MLPIAWYLLKVIICSGILYGYYWLLLRNKVFHKYNRFYLVVSVVLSLLLPLIKINFWQQDAPQQAGVIKVLQAVSNGDEYMDAIIVTSKTSTFNTDQLYPVAYLMISLILFIIFLHTLYSIYKLLKRFPKQIINKVSFVNTDAKSTPFSFLNYIFWNHNIDMESSTGNQIFKHELAHVEEKHTYDKLFINIVLIFFWCNPFFWLYRKELNMIHEFIADKKAVEDSDTAAFAAMILQATYPQHRFQLTNNFFYSPIKRRLLMLTKNKNPRVNYFGRIMVLPLMLIIFAAFTFKSKTSLHFYNGKKIIVVIDAGHGGKDGGANSADGIYEKDLVLSISKKVKELNDNEAVEIILTRDKDIYMSPAEKVAFAKSKNADLLISLHIDGEPEAVANKHTGMSVWVAKDEFANAAKSKLLATTILNEFDANYGLAVMTPLNQRKQDVYVLQANDCPAVLIEAGFISNKKDLNYLQTNAAQETIAKNLLSAIEKFAVASSQNRIVEEIVPASNALNTKSFYVNTKHADTNYLKSNSFKNKALVIVDNKTVGNFGMNYIEKNISTYRSIVIYSPDEAKKLYGDQGNFGAIVLTVKESATLTADSIITSDNNHLMKLAGNNTKLKGDFSNALIYIDNKISSSDQLNKLNPEKIQSVNILTGDKLPDIPEAKEKYAVIYVTLKPANLQEVLVQGYKTEKPLCVVDGQVKDGSFDLKTIAPDQIASINVLKDKSAVDSYGEKGKNGVLLITTKNKEEAVVTGHKTPFPLYIINGKETSKEDADKINPDKITSVDVLKDKMAVEKYGDKGKNGVVLITLKNSLDRPSELVVNGYQPKDKSTSEPLLALDGVRITKMRIGDFKRSKLLTAGLGYEVISANVYFTGTGFPSPSVFTINGNNLSQLSELSGKCSSGSVVTFDNVRVKGPNNYYATIEGISVALYDELNSGGIKIFTKVEQEPAYPGGADEWRNYLQKNLNTAIPVEEGWKAGTYTVIVQFVVFTDGSVRDVKTLNYQETKTAKHCIDLIKKSAKWIPAVQNGTTVNAYRKQPITFVITSADEKKSVTIERNVPRKFFQPKEMLTKVYLNSMDKYDVITGKKLLAADNRQTGISYVGIEKYEIKTSL